MCRCHRAGGNWRLVFAIWQDSPDCPLPFSVPPFTNVGGDANSDYLSDGITESLIANLTHVPQLKVKSRNSVFRYKGKDVDVQKAGGELRVSALASGRVTRHGDNVEVNAELTDVRDNTEIWGQHYSSKSADVMSIQQQIAVDIAAKLAITIHKSQGSEFPAVVIPLATQHYMLLQRNLIYTGITRGKRLLVLIGQKKALGIAVRNDRPQRRYSGLLAILRRDGQSSLA